jgi:hypothetical protein
MDFPDCPADTSPKMWAIYIDLIRSMDPAYKINLVFRLAFDLKSRLEAGVRYRFPGASQHEVLIRTAALYLDRKTMIRAYGWDPTSNDPVPQQP